MKFKKITTIMLAAVAAFSAIGATTASAVTGSYNKGYSRSHNGIDFVQGWGKASGDYWVNYGYLAIKGGGQNTATGSRTYKITGKVADSACNYGYGMMEFCRYYDGTVYHYVRGL